MNMNIVSVVALTVTPTQILLFTTTGETIRIRQGDPRVTSIIETCTNNRNLLAQGIPVSVDITVHYPKRAEYVEAEQSTNGFVKFFRMGKAALAKLFKGDEPDVLPVSPHVAPMEIKPLVTTSEPVIAGGLAVGSAVAQDLEPTDEVKAEPTQAELQAKAICAIERMTSIMTQGTPTSEAEFHKPLGDDETIVAVLPETGGIVPDVQHTVGQLQAAGTLDSYKGYQAFLARVAPVIESRRHSMEDLMQFMRHTDMPICDDGCILGYKRLGRKADGTFTDCHTGKVIQRIGSEVFVNPSLVDPDRLKDCSNGLHVASLDYVFSFSNRDAIVLVKFRPEDVFAVPTSDTTKIRVSAYHLLVELDPNLLYHVNDKQSIAAHPDGAAILSHIIAGNHVPVLDRVEITEHNGGGLVVTKVEGITPIEVKPAAPVVEVSTGSNMEPKLPVSKQVDVLAVEPTKAKRKPTTKKVRNTGKRKAKPTKVAKPVEPKVTKPVTTKGEAKAGSPRALIIGILSVPGDLSPEGKAEAQALRKRAKKSFAAMGFSEADIKRLS